MRKFWSSADEYDQKLRNYIKMTPEDCKDQESHQIFAHYQHKHSMFNGKLILYFIIDRPDKVQRILLETTQGSPIVVCSSEYYDC